MTSGAGPGVRWAVSPHDGRCHAFAPEQADGAQQRGHAEALCHHTMPGRLIVAEAPSGAICMQCATVVASELPDPP